MKLFSLSFQPEAPQWPQAFLRNTFASDSIFLRPAMIVKWGKWMKLLNPRLEIVATTDRWISYTEKIIHDVRAPSKNVIVPDAPDEYVLKDERGNYVILSTSHKLLLPNHEIEGNEVIDYIIARYLVEPLGESIDYVSGFSHDWCQDGFWDETKGKWISGGPIVEFRERFLARLWDTFMLPVYFNPGSASLAYRDIAEGVIMEGHELGGDSKQIRSAMRYWDTVGKSVHFISRPVNEHAGIPAEVRNPGGTNNLRLMRADYCRAAIFGADYSAAAGFFYDGFFHDMLAETHFDLGHLMGEIQFYATQNGKYFSKPFMNGEVWYSEAAMEIDLPMGYRLNSTKQERVILQPRLPSSLPKGYRLIGDGVILTKEPKFAVPDQIVGYDWIRSSPGQESFDLKGATPSFPAIPEGENPVTSVMPWVVGTNYNTFGSLYDQHGRVEIPKQPLTANFKVLVDGVYDVCVWKDGLWDFQEQVDISGGTFTYRLPPQSPTQDIERVSAVALRFSDPNKVKFASSFMLSASDKLGDLTPVIKISDRCLGIAFDGYTRNTSLRFWLSNDGNRIFTELPFRLRGGIWGPFRSTFCYALTWPPVEVAKDFRLDGMVLNVLITGDNGAVTAERVPVTIIA